MNEITDIIVISENQDIGIVDLINYLDINHTKKLKLASLIGGMPQYGRDVFMASVYDLDGAKFIDAFANAEWEWPNKAQLLLRTGNQERFYPILVSEVIKNDRS